MSSANRLTALGFAVGCAAHATGWVLRWWGVDLYGLGYAIRADLDTFDVPGRLAAGSLDLTRKDPARLRAADDVRDTRLK